MPFEPYKISTVGLFERIKLTPVPRDVLLAHKRKVEAAWREETKRRSRLQARPTRWLEFSERDCGSSTPRSLYVLSHAIGQMTQVYPATDGIPESVMTLAEKTRQRLHSEGVTDVSMRVGVFDTDPYLNVYCNGEVACLAIWDKQPRLTAFQWMVNTIVGIPADQHTILHIAHLG